MLTSVWRTAWLKGCVRKVHPLVADWCIASNAFKACEPMSRCNRGNEDKHSDSLRSSTHHGNSFISNSCRIWEAFNKWHTSCPIPVSSLIISTKNQKKTVYNGCMENSVKNWSSGWLKMLIYIVKPQTFAYGPQWCVMQLCFLFYLGWKQRYQTVHGKEGGTKAQDFLTSNVAWTQARASHILYSTAV